MLQFGDVCVTPFGLARGCSEHAAKMRRRCGEKKTANLGSPFGIATDADAQPS